MDKKQFYCFFLILMLLLSISIPIWLLLLLPSKTIILDFEYDDNCLLGTNVAVEGLQVDIHTPSSGTITSYTDVNGQVFIYITESGDYTFDYYWMNVGSGTLAIDESYSQTINIELTTHSIQPMFYWAHDLSAYSDPIDLQYYDGSAWVDLITVDPQTDGSLADPILGLFLGEFRFENANDTFTIDRLTSEPAISEIFIVPIGIIISIIESITIIGIVCYKIKKKTTIQKLQILRSCGGVQGVIQLLIIFFLSLYNKLKRKEVRL